VFHEAAGNPTLATRNATGVYRAPRGPLEINPSFVARPQVEFEGKPGSQWVGSEQAALLNAIEAIRSVVGAQNAGAWSIPIRDNPNRSRSVFLTYDRPLTQEQAEGLMAVGTKHGVPNIIDYGEAAVLTKFGRGKPSPQQLAEALEKASLRRDLTDIMPGTEPFRVQLGTGYSGFEDAWRQKPGSGAVIRRLGEFLDHPAIPGMIEKFDAHPELRQVVRDKYLRDLNWAKRSGDVLHEDVERAHQVINSEGLIGLYRAAQKGALPAALIVPLVETIQSQSQEPL
jgi:hypothetical protein